MNISPALVVVLTGMAASAGAAVITLDFESIDATQGPASVLGFGSYFAQNNIPLIGWQVNTLMCVFDTRSTWGGAVRPPNGEHNVLSLLLPSPDDPQPPAPHGIILRFATPLTQFSFVRPAFTGTSDAPFIHPGWTLSAMAGDYITVVATATEASITGTDFVPKRIVSISSPTPISQVLFSADGGGVSSVPAMLIDSMTMTTAVPAPGAAVFFAAGLIALRRRR